MKYKLIMNLFKTYLSIIKLSINIIQTNIYKFLCLINYKFLNYKIIILYNKFKFQMILNYLVLKNNKIV
jgi:hypothetical protein